MNPGGFDWQMIIGWAERLASTERCLENIGDQNQRIEKQIDQNQIIIEKRIDQMKTDISDLRMEIRTDISAIKKTLDDNNNRPFINITSKQIGIAAVTFLTAVLAFFGIELGGKI